jgi:putative effector of murein hydrolase
VLAATGTGYATYVAGARFVPFLLGPATVALALPRWRHLGEVRRMLLPMALAVGAPTAIVSAVGVTALLGASPATLASLAPKSVTPPIATAVSARLAGCPRSRRRS